MKKNSFILKSITTAIIICITTATYIGCKKTADINSSELNINSTIADFVFKSKQPTDGNINFTIQDETYARFQNNQGIPIQSFSAGFYKNRNTNDYITINQLSIDSRKINNNGVAYSVSQFGISNDTAKWMNSFWGRNINLSIDNTNTTTTTGTGSSNNNGTINSTAGQLYIPTAIQINQNYNDSKLAILHKSGQAITWNSDPNNPSKKVYIMVVYDAYTSRLVYPNMPINNSIVFQKEVDDAGSYTFTSDDLKDVLLNCSAKIQVARGNYVSLKDNVDSTKNVFVTALTTSTLPVVVNN